MKSLIAFLKSFLNNKGGLVFISLLTTKVAMLFNSLFIIKLLLPEEFGLVVVISAFFNFLVPLDGWGANQALLKYGSENNNEFYQQSLKGYFFNKGLLNQLLVGILFIGLTFRFIETYEQALFIISCFVLRLLGFYIMGFVKNSYRIQGDNRTFSWINIVVFFIGTIITVIATYLWHLNGYIVGLTFMPFLSIFFIQRKKIAIDYASNTDISLPSKTQMWRYGIMSSIAYLLSELFYSLDVLLIEKYMTTTDVAIYKVMIILPFNLLFLSSTMLQTDFPKLVAQGNDTTFIKNYLINYWKLFSIIGVSILLGSYFLKDIIISIFFKDSYIVGTQVFFINTIGVVIAMLFRDVFLNILTANGKSHWNALVTSVAILLLIATNAYLIPKYGMEGAVWGMVIAYVCSGLLGGILLKIYYHCPAARKY